MCNESPRSAWTRAFDNPDATWRLPATDIWPSFTLSARERQELARRLALTVTGWIVANPPTQGSLSGWLNKWRPYSLAEWFDRQAPTSNLYGVLMDELVSRWIGQAHANLPAQRAAVVVVDLEDWAELLQQVWDDEDTAINPEPIVRCYLELIRRYIEEVTVGAAWEAGLLWWQTNLPASQFLLVSQSPDKAPEA